MDDDSVMAEMLQHVKAHELSTVRVIRSKMRRSPYHDADHTVSTAFADEQVTRKDLIGWQAPTAPLAVKKLLHLLAHVLAAKLAFDEESLAEIEAESRRLAPDSRTSFSAPLSSGREPHMQHSTSL